MKIHCCQLDIAWEDKAANHAKARALIDGAAIGPGDLVLLPEMFATGFTMRAAEVDDAATGETQRFLARTAAELEIFLAGGIVTAEPGGLGRNECVVYSPEGLELTRYTKMHPFSYGAEARHYARGDAPCTFAWRDAVVAPFVCYDLRFPEVFRTAVLAGATVYVVIANWPAARIEHWLALLAARAIENQAYVAGVNRCGDDPKLAYNGASVIFDPKGRAVARAGDGEEVISAEVDLATLEAYRREFPFLADISRGYITPPR